jgi:predicted small secreted protein
MSKRFFALILSAVLLVITATACNTVHGAGQDIESVGAAMAGD